MDALNLGLSALTDAQAMVLLLTLACISAFALWQWNAAGHNSVNSTSLKRERSLHTRSQEEHEAALASRSQEERAGISSPLESTGRAHAGANEAERETPVYQAQASQVPTNPIWVLNIMPSRTEAFVGYDLLQALSQVDVHLNDKQIFARYETQQGQGSVWFYIASAEHPGTFQIEEPGKINCKGLVMILNSEKVDALVQAYAAFITAAKFLAKELGGKLLDQQQQKLDEKQLSLWQAQVHAKNADKRVVEHHA